MNAYTRHERGSLVCGHEVTRSPLRSPMRLDCSSHATHILANNMSVCICRHQRCVRDSATDKTCMRTHAGCSPSQINA